MTDYYKVDGVTPALAAALQDDMDKLADVVTAIRQHLEANPGEKLAGQPQAKYPNAASPTMTIAVMPSLAGSRC